MMGERFPALNIKIYQEIPMPDGSRIVLADPIHHYWHDLYLANHDVFRIDRNGEVIWQVHREESKFVNWESRNQHAKRDDPDCEGYLDPFTAMSTKFFERRPLPDKGPFHPKFEEVSFDEYAPGRLLWLITQWWAYDLDPETGIATCIGEQVK